MGQMNIDGRSVAEIFENIRREVHAGRLVAGELLPTVRELAGRLQVNRNTVAAAYRRLVAAGIAQTLGRNGTLIRELAQPGEQEGTAPGSTLCDLAGGSPDPALLPDLQAVLAAGGSYRPHLYGEPVLDAELERLARRWLQPDCRPGCTLQLAHGAVDAIERLLAAYLVAGDKVAVEDPCFLGSINTLRLAGLEALAVAVDAEGMRPQALAAALAAGAQAVLCTSRAHNPTGCSLTPARAAALREVLAAYPHVLVIEDDHFALLARTPFCSIVPAATAHWALVRSVSKAFGPDLRLACVASDADTAGRLAMRLAPGTTWVSHLLQGAVRTLLASPAAMQQVEQAAECYAARRATLIDALRSEGIDAAEPCDGLNVWVPLTCDPAPLLPALARQGWLLRGGTGFAIAAPAHALRITVSTLDAATARRFAADLRRLMV